MCPVRNETDNTCSKTSQLPREPLTSRLRRESHLGLNDVDEDNNEVLSTPGREARQHRAVRAPKPGWFSKRRLVPQRH